jgi:hypothetical protein
MAIPRYQRKKRGKQKPLSSLIQYDTVPSPKKGKPPKAPSKKPTKESEPSDRGRSLASGLASAAQAMPGGGYAGVVKAGLAGAAAGAEIDTAYKKYKAKRAKSKTKKATTTVTQSAMAQKAKYHKKDPTSTKRT